MPAPAESLDTKHAGVGVSIFNAVGAAIGGFMGPFVVGAFVQRMGTFVSSMVAMGAFLCASGVMMVGLGIYTQVRKRRQPPPPAGRAGSDAVPDSRTDLLGDRPVQRKDVALASDVELGKRPNPRAHSVFKV